MRLVRMRRPAVRTILNLARAVPPATLARHACSALRQRTRALIDRPRDLAQPTHSMDAVALTGSFYRLPPEDVLRRDQAWLATVGGLSLDHCFDLLGSGWVQIRHGMVCRGTEGHRFPPQPEVVPDAGGRWLADRLPRAALAESQRVWQLVDAGYQPIDWHLDFKSGYRWSEATWHLDVPLGHLPGVDVKVPWELARMQHLPQLALARALAVSGTPGFAEPDRYGRAFRNQVLDFIATNPPRFGVNWRCTMDVAIRVANWLIAYDLFRDGGAAFDAGFEAVFARSVQDHARHIADNLEDGGGFRGNHYLADICGLLYAAAWLPPALRVTKWLSLATTALIAETQDQFLDDGGNFEGSTSYHRLSAEMVFHATALAAALKARRPDLPELPPSHWRRLAAIAEFARAVMKPNGMVPQIGDSDSGRFVKLSAAYRRIDTETARRRFIQLRDIGIPDGAGGYWFEEYRDHRPLLALADAVLKPQTAPTSVEAAVVARLCTPAAGPVSEAPPPAAIHHSPAPAANRPVAQFRVHVPGGGLRAGLAQQALPAFGLYVMRSERLYLAVRCGSVGQNGRGGHAHNDQLAVELAIDGEDWISDPGTYLYTPSPEARNRYRSVAAHFAPRLGHAEPSPLDVGPFWLPRDPKAACHRFADGEFVGSHRGFGPVVVRRIRVTDDSIEIEDTTDAKSAVTPVSVICVAAAETRARLQPHIPISPAYGLQLAG